VRGRDFWSARLPDDHPVFSSFFHIKGGVPIPEGADSAGKFSVPNHLIGYFVKGRLAGISFLGVGSFRHLQMTINIVIYALTQEGSMTQRLMQMVN